MALTNLTNLEKKGGAGFGGTGLGEPTLKGALTELQGLKRNIAAGFAGGGSVAVSGMSAARGDVLVSVWITSAALSPVDVTASASIVNGRLKVVDTSSASKKLDVLWFNFGGH